jgi:uncharacterized tellurite resistance protein B-like protein
MKTNKPEQVKEEVERHPQKVKGDPSDEYLWNQEQKLLLLRVMVAAAIKDGFIAPEELNLLKYKLEKFQLSGAYYRKARHMLQSPSSQDEDIKRIEDDLKRMESYEMRYKIFKHALGIVFSDGLYKHGERKYIKRLSRILNIGRTDWNKISSTFSCQDWPISTEDIESLIAEAEQSEPNRENNNSIEGVGE